MIHIHDSSDGLFYFTVTAKNGRVLVTSETYKERRNALKGALALYEVLTGLWDEKKGLQVRSHTA